MKSSMIVSIIALCSFTLVAAQIPQNATYLITRTYVDANCQYAVAAEGRLNNASQCTEVPGSGQFQFQGCDRSTNNQTTYYCFDAACSVGCAIATVTPLNGSCDSYSGGAFRQQLQCAGEYPAPDDISSGNNTGIAQYANNTGGCSRPLNVQLYQANGVCVPNLGGASRVSRYATYAMRESFSDSACATLVSSYNFTIDGTCNGQSYSTGNISFAAVMDYTGASSGTTFVMTMSTTGVAASTTLTNSVVSLTTGAVSTATTVSSSNPSTSTTSAAAAQTVVSFTFMAAVVIAAML